MKTISTLIISLFFLFFSYPAEAQTQAELADWKQQIQKATHDTTRLRLYSKVRDYYQVLTLDTCYSYLQKAEVIAKRYPTHEATVDFFYALGFYWYRKEDRDKSNLYYEKAIKLAQEKGYTNSFNYKRALFSLARDLDNEGDLSLSLRKYIELEKQLSDKQPYRSLKRKIYYNIANIYYELGDTLKAIPYANKAFAYATNRSDSLISFILLSKLHQCKIYNKEIEALIPVCFDKKNISQINSMSLTNAADYFLKIHQYKQAIHYLKIIDTFFQKINLNDLYVYQNMGEAYIGLKQYKEAILYLKKSQDLSINNHDYLNLQFCWECMAIAYQGMGNYKAAYEVQSKAVELKEKLTGIQTQKMVAQLNAQYELNEKQAQIAAKELENKVQQTRLQTEQKQKNILMGMMAITLALLLWATYNYSRKNKLSQALAKQRLQLSEANQLKDKLFAIVSHDLRSPISRLSNSLALMDIQGSELLQNIKKELSYTQLMLNNLLQWASWQMQKEKPISKQPTCVSVAIHGVVQELKPLLEAKQIKLIEQQEAQETEIVMNETQFQVIIRNILSNAIKFTPQDGYIRLQTNIENDKVMISIKDSGIGMNEDQLAKVFNYPTSRHGTMNEKGSGIGLSLCKELIEQNKGSITLKSTPDKGTEVKLIFPIFS